MRECTGNVCEEKKSISLMKKKQLRKASIFLDQDILLFSADFVGTVYLLFWSEGIC